MTTLLTVLVALSAAGGLAWLVHRYESAREARPSACSRAVNEVFAKGASDTADSVLLKELLVHRDRCLGDADFVDQARRLMANVRQTDEARKLLEYAESRNAMTADEFKAQHAWIDVAEAQQKWSDGDETGATALRDRAIAAATALRAKWPEWSMPYRILADATPPDAPGQTNMTEQYDLQLAAQSRKLNGAWARSLADWQPPVFAFVTAAIGFLALAVGLNGFLSAREFSKRETSSIAVAKPGYVELKGTLHRVPGSQVLTGPLTGEPVVWYQKAYNSGSKKATTFYERSERVFLLRDATGEVIVDPASISVKTQHTTTRYRSGASTARTSEDRLIEGDSAFALGELSITTNAQGEVVRRLKVANNGRRLLVSNYSESQLVGQEMFWAAIGLTIFAMSVTVLAWSYAQRYHVAAMPGILR